MHIDIAEITHDGENDGVKGLDVRDVATGGKLLYVYDIRLEINRQMLTAEVVLGGRMHYKHESETDHVRSIGVVRYGPLDFIVTRNTVLDTIPQYEAFDNALPVGPEREMVRVQLN